MLLAALGLGCKRNKAVRKRINILTLEHVAESIGLSEKLLVNAGHAGHRSLGPVVCLVAKNVNGCSSSALSYLFNLSVGFALYSFRACH